MCGIIGYIGKKEPVPILLKGLEALEYRGYDSAGIALLNNDGVQVVKAKGKIKDLKETLATTKLITSHMGLGHTRWATHGVPSIENAHPHTVGKITIVHNGMIENMQELKEMLENVGYTFQTETDTEVMAALLDYYDEGDLCIAIQKSCEAVKGSYAFGVIHEKDTTHLYAVRKNAPLVIGIKEEEKYMASDIGAILPFTRNYIELPSLVIAKIAMEKVELIDFRGHPVPFEIQTSTGDLEAQSKAGYEHYMLKEIMEEPCLIKKMIMRLARDKETLLASLPDISDYEEVHIVACGSALYAGMIGKHFLEEYAKVHVLVEVASEYQYQNIKYDRKTLVILISQSGETADTISCLYKVKKEKIPTLGIVNVKTSTLAKHVDIPLFIEAGREIAVATTKAYINQVLSFALLVLKTAYQKGFILEKELLKILEEAKTLPEKIKEICSRNYHHLARELYKNNDIFFIGRGIDYAICMEGSLKLKEVSYLHSESYQAGELKHGTISLIQEGTPVIAIITNEKLKEKTLSNLKETEARGAKTIILTTEEVGEQAGKWIIKVDTGSVFFKPLLLVPVLQLLAYEVARVKGCEIDQPKNLAKSVTVE